MKFSILGAFLIFVAVIAFTCSSCYTNKSEGMTDITDYRENYGENYGETKQTKSFDIQTLKSTVMDMMNDITPTQDSEQNQYMNDNADAVKVEGFQGILSHPESINSIKTLDTYYNAKGDNNCFNQSSGLSNSKGPLCLDDMQKKMLQTRGGNAKSGEAQIGF